MFWIGLATGVGATVAVFLIAVLLIYINTWRDGFM